MSAVTDHPIKTKIRDIAPTAVRLMPDLKAQLAREAAINGRALHAEIVARLTDSLKGRQDWAGRIAEDLAQDSSGLAFGVIEQTDAERRLLAAYKKMSPEKQLALLTLLR